MSFNTLPGNFFASQFMYTWVIGIVALIVVYTKFLRKDPRIIKHLQNFNGPPTIPILGNSLDLLKPPEELIGLGKSLIENYGRIFRIWVANISFVLLAEAEAVEKLLSSTVHLKKGNEYEVVHPWLGTGLLASNGEKWQKRRKLISPAFHFKVLEEFVVIFNEHAATLVEVVEKKAIAGNVFDIYPLIARCALDIICETAMGKKVYAQKKDSEYIAAVDGMCEIILERLLRPWLRPVFIWNLSPQGRKEKKLLKILHNFTETVIKERKAERRNVKKDEQPDDFGVKKRKAFLDLLIDISETEDGMKILNDLGIREETDTFLFEGYDTAAANLNWNVFLLALHPDIRKRVHEEIDAVFPLDDPDSMRPMSMNDLSQFKLLECCVKESLRLFPSVMALSRDLQKDFPIGNGKIIPKGTQALIFPYLLHRDERVFPNPESFIPERFLPENSLKRNPFAYVPFSAGPRNCVGQKYAMLEIKTVLAHLLRSYDFEAGERMEDVILVPNLVLRPKNGINVRLIKRR